MNPLALGLITGVAFGFALHRVGFKRPNIVQRGLWLRDFTMVRTMIVAIIVGLVGMYAISAVAPDLVHFKIKPLYVAGVLVGGALFGGGMALAGYCPGTGLVGLGAGRMEAAMAVLGGLFGALAFIFSYPALKPLFVEPFNLGRITIPSVLGLPALPTALVFALVMASVLVALTKPGATPEVRYHTR